MLDICYEELDELKQDIMDDIESQKLHLWQKS